MNSCPHELMSTPTMVSTCLTAITVLLILPLRHATAVDVKEVSLEDVVTILCNMSLYHDIHWLKMSAEGLPSALMVTSLKHTGELSVVWNSDKTRYEGFFEKRVTGLRILNISANDLATYYCMTFKGKEMVFGKGVKLYTNQENNKETEQCFDKLQGGLSHYHVFASVLSLGLLGMLLTVSLVHMKTRTTNTDK